MVGLSPILSPINEEIARLKWFEEFMRKRWLVLFLPLSLNSY